MLAALATRQTREAIDLSNGISIEVHVSSYRSVRGYQPTDLQRQHIALRD